MNILVLPNAFKGSLSAAKAALLFTRALKKKHRVCAIPVSDGGDGFLDFFKTLDPAAHKITLTVKNAFLKNRRTDFLLLSDGKTAIIETARVCGLGSTKKEELDPLGASSYGVGQVLSAAAQAGAKTIYIGLGGVACNDGGAGMATACGAVFLDKRGRLLGLGAEALLNVKYADVSSLRKKFKEIKIFGVADVTNPLLGPKSSAKVFGPQKGATPAQVKMLDKAMAAYARVIKQETGRDIAHLPCTAAAGAIGAGLAGCFGAKLLLGSNFLFQKAGLEKYFQKADLIITTEGKLD
ncbi:MAG: glycerate kinase, partial [Candidatus Avelusimicrobium sp.]